MPVPPQPITAIGGLTYAEFLLVFLVVPLVVLAVLRVVLDTGEARLRSEGVALLVVIALGYTAPVDNFLIARGVWEYGEGAVVAFGGYAPIEEYLFIILQPIVTARWLGLVWPGAGSMALAMPAMTRLPGVIMASSIGVAGAVMLLYDPTYYLGAILLWSAPVLMLQWGVGWPYLWRHRRTVAMGVIVPTLYFCLADRIAIGIGIWTLSDRFTTGISARGLPIEEALFFLATNLFVVQGLMLFEWVMAQWR